MKRFVLCIVVLGLIFFYSGNSYAWTWIRLQGVVPSSCKAGEPFYMTVSLSYANYTVNNSPEVYLDVSFPDNPEVEVVEKSDGWSNVGIYLKGEKIWYLSSDGDMKQKNAEYLLVSAYKIGKSWGGETQWIKLKITPPKQGTNTLSILYRGTVGDKCKPTSGIKDQQGFYCYKETVEIKPKKGKLRITSNPAGAKIYIAWKEFGSTPLNVSLEKGNYFISAVKSGYKTQSKNIYVSPGKTTNVNFNLEPIERKFNISGYVRYREWPKLPAPKIKVYAVSAANKYETETDWNGFFKIPNVPKDTYSIRVDKVDFEFEPKDIYLNSNKKVNLNIKCRATPKIWLEGVPKSWKAGKPFYIKVNLKNTNYAVSSPKVYLDISFPDNPEVKVVEQSRGWSYVGIYPKGRDIWCLSFSNGQSIMKQKRAKYLLVSAEKTGIYFNKPQWIKLRITPKPGTKTLRILYRGTIGDRRDPTSGIKDQQGFYCYEETVEIKQPEFKVKKVFIGEAPGEEKKTFKLGEKVYIEIIIENSGETGTCDARLKIEYNGEVIKMEQKYEIDSNSEKRFKWEFKPEKVGKYQVAAGVFNHHSEWQWKFESFEVEEPEKNILGIRFIDKNGEVIDNVNIILKTKDGKSYFYEPDYKQNLYNIKKGK